MKSTVLAMGLTFALAGFAFAAPQSIGDCEKIADPDAYNRCLAAFGPAMRPQRFTDVPSGKVSTGDVKQPEASRDNRGRGYRASRRGRTYGKASARHGRVRMEIPIGGGSGSKSSRRRGRRH